jgi:RNA polymerase-binding transcription factor DksA
MPQTPPDIRPHLDAIRRTLLERRAAVLAQVQHGERDRLVLLDQMAEEPEPNEEGQEDELADQLALLDARGQEEIHAIDRALARIAADEFGYCSEGGEPIPLARLRALPTAETCVAHAEQADARARAARGPGSRTL